MKKPSLRTSMLFTVLCGLAVAFSMMSTIQSCKKDNTVAKTLYDTLGGTTMVQDPSAPAGTMIETGRLGIRSVVDSAIFIIAGDTQINKYFTVLLSEVGQGNLTGFTALSKNLTDFFCVATGAKDFTYTGKTMTAAHDPATNNRISQKVDAGDFGQFINDVGASAVKNGLNTYDIDRLVTVMKSVQSQVVQQ